MSLARSLRRHAEGAAKLAPVRPAFGNGIRGAVATVAPLIAAHFLGIPEPGLMGLAGFGTAIVDKGGAYRARATAMTSFALLGSLSALVGVAASRSVVSAIAVSFAWIAFCGIIRVYGAAAASVGSMSAVIYVVSLASHGTIPDGVERGVLVLAGCAWGMLLALIVWPIRFYRPARGAVANCYRAIAQYARDIAGASEIDSGDWAAIFSRNHTRIHEALEHARSVLAATRRGRQGESGRGERLLILLEESDRMMTSIIGIADAVQSNSNAAKQTAQEVLSTSAERAMEIASAIESEKQIVRIAPMQIQPSLPQPIRHLATELQHHEDTAIAAANQLHVELPDDAAERVLVGIAKRRSLLEPLTANLDFSSVVLRHALRVGTAAAIATALVSALGLHRGYWVTISAIVVLQPYVDATFRKGLQRVAGSIIGGILAAIAVAIVPHSGALLIVIFIAAATSLAVLPINYGVYATFTTPTFVLLAEMNTGDWHLARIRIVNTLLGGAIAFVCARVFWPTPEETLFPQRLSAAVGANRRYLAALLDYLVSQDATPPADLRAARRNSAIALLNLEASLQRLMGERDVVAEPLMTLVVFNRRFSVALTALASRKQAIRIDREYAEAIDRRIAGALESIRIPLPPSRTDADFEFEEPFVRLGEIVEILQSAASRALPMA